MDNPKADKIFYFYNTALQILPTEKLNQPFPKLRGYFLSKNYTTWLQLLTESNDFLVTNINLIVQNHPEQYVYRWDEIQATINTFISEFNIKITYNYRLICRAIEFVLICKCLNGAKNNGNLDIKKCFDVISILEEKFNPMRYNKTGSFLFVEYFEENLEYIDGPSYILSAILVSNLDKEITNVINFFLKFPSEKYGLFLPVNFFSREIITFIQQINWKVFSNEISNFEFELMVASEKYLNIYFKNHFNPVQTILTGGLFDKYPELFLESYELKYSENPIFQEDQDKIFINKNFVYFVKLYEHLFNSLVNFENIISALFEAGIITITPTIREDYQEIFKTMKTDLDLYLTQKYSNAITSQDFEVVCKSYDALKQLFEGVTENDFTDLTYRHLKEEAKYYYTQQHSKTVNTNLNRFSSNIWLKNNKDDNEEKSMGYFNTIIKRSDIQVAIRKYHRKGIIYADWCEQQAIDFDTTLEEGEEGRIDRTLE